MLGYRDRGNWSSVLYIPSIICPREREEVMCPEKER
jgi:hypothetical protein